MVRITRSLRDRSTSRITRIISQSGTLCGGGLKPAHRNQFSLFIALPLSTNNLSVSPCPGDVIASQMPTSSARVLEHGPPTLQRPMVPSVRYRPLGKAARYFVRQALPSGVSIVLNLRPHGPSILKRHQSYLYFILRKSDKSETSLLGVRRTRLLVCTTLRQLSSIFDMPSYCMPSY